MNGIIKALQCHPRVRKIPSAPVLSCAVLLLKSSGYPGRWRRLCTQPALTTQDLCPTHTLFNQMHNAYIIHKEKYTHSYTPSLAIAGDDNGNLGSDLAHVELRHRQPASNQLVQLTS